MSKSARSLPGQESLFLPDQPPVRPPVNLDSAVPEKGLTEQQTDEFDRLDAQGMRNAIGVRSEIGAAALTDKGDSIKPIFMDEESDLTGPNGKKLVYEVMINPQSIQNETGRPLKSRSRRGLGPDQLRRADGPPTGYQGQ